IARDAERGLLAERDDALLAALPQHAYLLLLEVDVAEIQAHCLVTTQAGRVHQLDERLVSDRERVGTDQGIERTLYLSLRRRVRQTTRAARRERRLRDARRPEREAKEAAHRGELPPDRRRGKLARPRLSELSRVVRQDPHVDVVQLDAPLREPVAE